MVLYLHCSGSRYPRKLRLGLGAGLRAAAIFPQPQAMAVAVLLLFKSKLAATFVTLSNLRDFLQSEQRVLYAGKDQLKVQESEKFEGRVFGFLHGAMYPAGIENQSVVAEIPFQIKSISYNGLESKTHTRY